MQISVLFTLWKIKPGILLITLSLLLGACSSLPAGIPIQELFTTLEAGALAGKASPAPLETSESPSPELPLSIPESSPTPRISSQSTPSLTVNPTAVPTETPSPAPTVSSDLIYLSNNQLMRWDHVTQFATLLVDRVSAYTALVDPFSAYQLPNSPENAVKKFPRLIALLRSHEITANGKELFDLDILNLETKQIVNLYEKISKIESMQFSLQGDRLVYIDRSIDDRIVVTKTSQGSETQLIATCHREGNITCQNVWWSPDGRSLAWSDALGIWLSDDRSSSLRQIQSNRIKIMDPKNQESEIKVTYEVISWSPDSRFLLVKIIPSAQGVQWYSVLDTRMSRLVDIPGTADFSTPTSKIAWTNAGDLWFASSSNPQEEQDAFIQVWKIVPTHNALLVAGERYQLSQSASGALKTLFSQEVICPNWFQQLGPTTFRFGLIAPDGDTQAILTQFDIEENTLEQYLSIPADTEKILWATDGSGALILGKRGQVIFASLSNQELLDLLPSIGSDAHSFQWLSPAPR